MQFFPFNQIQNGVFLINNMNGLNQLRDQGALSQANYEALLQTSPWPILYIASEQGLAAMVPWDVLQEYASQEFWMIDDNTTANQIHEVLTFIGEKPMHTVCRKCWEKDGTIVHWKDFDGEVIETCPTCKGEALKEVPYDREEMITHFKAVIKLSPSKKEKLRDFEFGS
ncbi:hypothetical protein SM033_00075 [Vibrio phage vB_VpaM_sm033]|nr:hypothetical protein SM033_00075 [Vibrio phage vB_VpaM_sm033]